jgi:hypothetical protein
MERLDTIENPKTSSATMVSRRRQENLQVENLEWLQSKSSPKRRNQAHVPTCPSMVHNRLLLAGVPVRSVPESVGIHDVLFKLAIFNPSQRSEINP